MFKINIHSIYWSRYIRFIESRSFRIIPEGSCVEIHHIIPKCAGGDDLPNNLIKLTIREHFIAHWILSKVGIDDVWYKLRFAFGCMSVSSKSNSYRKFLTSRQFEISKKIRQETLKIYNDSVPSRVKGTRWYVDEDGTVYRCHANSPKIEEFGLKPRSPMKGKNWYTDGANFFMLSDSDPKISSLELRRGCPGENKPKKYSNESAAKLSIDRAGRLWFNDGIKSFKLKPDDPIIKNLNLIPGRLISQEGMERIKKGAAWVRSDEHNRNNSLRQQSKFRYNDGVRNFTLSADDPLIEQLSLVRGVLLTEEGRNSLSERARNTDRSYAIGKKWFNDGIKNYRLSEQDGIDSGFFRGKLHKVKPIGP